MSWIKPIRRVWLRYAVAILIVLVAAAIRMWFLGALGERIPFFTFIPAVMLVALFCGFPAGVVATLLSTFFAAAIQSTGQPVIALTPLELRYASLAVFAFGGVVVSWVFKESHRARSRASQADSLEKLAAEKEIALEALRKSQAVLSSVVESLPFDFWATGQDGRFMLSNSMAQQNWKDMLGKLPAEIDAPPETAAFWQECISRALAGEQMRKEVRFERGGQTLFADCVVAPIRDEHSIIGALGMNIDITERIRTENTLKQSEKRWRMYLETANEGVFTMTADSRISYVNQRLADMLDFLPEEMINTPIEHYAFDEDIPAIRTKIENRRQGIRERYELRLRRKNGEEIWTLLSAMPLQGEDGSFQGSFAMFVDITDLKRVEEALRKREEDLARAQAITHLGSWSWDIETNEVSWSDEMYRIFGVARDTYRPTPEANRSFIHPEDLPRHLEWLNQPESPKHLKPCEYRIIRPNGEARHVQVFVDEIRNEASSPPRVFGAILDITESKQIEEELRRLSLEAQAASRAKSEFLANMSHEIRTPLSAILGLTELSQRVTDPAKISANLGMIADSAKTLLEIVGDVLDLSRVEAGKLTLVVKPFDLRRTMERALVPYRLVFRDKSLDLNLEIPETVPTTLMGDPVRLGQVFANLIGNAVKFTKQGGITVSVAVSGRPSLGLVELHFQVADTGIGIAPELREVIFESFRQADSTFSKSYQGVGLGLAICRELTALMGGKIWVESTLGTGSIFHFTGIFPLPTEREASEAVSSTSPPATGPLRVLVVEDNPVNRRVFTHFLTSMGHLVTTAIDGQEALTKLGSTEFDLIFLDVQMPKLDGIEVVRRLRAGECGENAAKVPVVALTAYAMASDRERFLGAGMTGYLSKPVSMEALQAAIAQYATHPDSNAYVRPDIETP